MLHAPQLWRMKIFQHFTPPRTQKSWMDILSNRPPLTQRMEPRNVSNVPRLHHHHSTQSDSTPFQPIPLRRTKSLTFELHEAAQAARNMDHGHGSSSDGEDPYDHYDGPLFTMDDDDDDNNNRKV